MVSTITRWCCSVSSVWLLLLWSPCVALAQSPEGSLHGVVEDAERRVPIAGAEVEIIGGTLQSRTDAHGVFAMTSVPVGVLAVAVRHPDYIPQVLSDVVVHSGRSTEVKVRLVARPRFQEQVIVRPDFFPHSWDQDPSAVAFSHEEIRRAAGTGGDITKFFQALPSVANVNTMMNHLVVRGGSPIENTSYIDGIEVPLHAARSRQIDRLFLDSRVETAYRTSAALEQLVEPTACHIRFCLVRGSPDYPGPTVGAANRSTHPNQARQSNRQDSNDVKECEMRAPESGTQNRQSEKADRSECQPQEKLPSLVRSCQK